MRRTLLFILLSGSVCGFALGQSMVETAAAAAGGSVGGVAGKKVSDGLTRIFEKVDKQAAKAAKPGEGKPSPAVRRIADDTSAPLLEVSPGVPKSDSSNVPPPPPVRHAAVHALAKPEAVLAVEPAPIVPPPPPPPVVTADDLKRVSSGMQREDVLKLGEPASKITMVDEGHLLEIYRYQANDATFGVVRLTDGAVSNVRIQ
jgi:hypothetical protein